MSLMRLREGTSISGPRPSQTVSAGTGIGIGTGADIGPGHERTGKDP